MVTIPHVATIIQTVLTTVADTAGQHTRFVQRPRRAKLTGSTFTQTLVFGWLADPDASLDSLAQTVAAVGAPITAQALDQRFTPAAAGCLQEVLAATLQQVVAADSVAVPLLRRFPHVVVKDPSTVVLPNALAEVWRGCGGDAHYNTQASVKLGVQYDLTTVALWGHSWSMDARMTVPARSNTCACLRKAYGLRTPALCIYVCSLI
jgi:hypothetical protein